MSDKRLTNLDVFLCTILTCFVAALFYFIIINISFLNVFTKAFEDFEFTDIFYANQSNQEALEKDIVLVNIEQHSRKQIAEAINKVNAQSASVIGIDIVFKELKDRNDDSLLKDALAKPNIVTSFILGQDSLVRNHSFFDSQSSGFINVHSRDGHSIIRDFQTFEITYTKDTLVSFPVAVYQKSRGKTFEKLPELKDRIPIDFSGNIDHYVVFDIPEIMSQDTIPILKNKVVIFGYLGTPTNNLNDIEDKHFTPMNNAIAGKAVPDMYGAIIHANILKMLNTNSFVTLVSSFWTYILAIICCMLAIKYSFMCSFEYPVMYEILIKFVQFLISVLIIGVALFLLKLGFLVYVTPVLVLTLLGLEMTNIYKSLKSKWQ